ncbi:MAG: hypothetical protein E6I36_01610 [Chloroflexi bacterium]|nr:MAG: hypothetical protein E6I36_01610 [Chloroflexota bacterium]
MTRSIRASLAVTAAVMPLYVVRWRVGPIPTTLLESAILFTLALYVGALILERGPLPRRTPLDIPIGLFLVAGVIGVFVAPDHRGAVGIFRAYLLEPIAVYYVGVAVIRRPDDVYRILAVGAIGAAVFAAGEVLTLAHAVITNRVVLGHVDAVLGINPNSVALYLEPLIGLSTGFVAFAVGRRRWIAAGLLVLLTLAELATLSRGGILALGALVIGVILTIRSLRLRAAIMAGGIAGAILLTQLPLIGPRLQHALDPGRGTFDVRGDIWVATARMLRDHPIFGAGINAYQDTMAPYRKPFPILSPEPYPHNIFLTSWTELGILGMVAFTLIVGILVVRSFRALPGAAAWARPLLWGTGMAFVMVVVHGLVDSPYWKNDLSVEFWILAALAVVAQRAGRET